MRKYDINDERMIRTERQVREWLRSGFIDAQQFDVMSSELKCNLRRTNLILRLVLFGFGFLIFAAAVLLVAITFNIHEESDNGILCLFAAAGAFTLAEVLITRFRLYRFGVEEAAATVSAVLVAVASGFITASLRNGTPIESALALTGAIAALIVYLRFGYLYAAIGSLACLLIFPFQTHMTEIMQRIVSAALLTGVFVVVRFIYREAGPEYPADEFAAIQASAWAGIYLVINLKLQALVPLARFVVGYEIQVPFYWLTWFLTWLLPAVGMYLALRDRDRVLLDVNIVLALVSLSTNKPYLGVARQTWDPILLGTLLIAIAVIVRRWLVNGLNNSRHGFTAERLLSSDKSRLSMIGTASVVFQPGASVPADKPSVFKPGGGRSGGAGASGSF